VPFSYSVCVRESRVRAPRGRATAMLGTIAEVGLTGIEGVSSRPVRDRAP